MNRDPRERVITIANKMLKLGILTEVGQRPKNAGSRIPVKYSFNSENYAELKSKGFRLEF